MNSQYKILLIKTLLTSSLLLGCGGNDSSPPPLILPTNQSPVVTVSGESSIQEGKTLTLTANATDADGSISSVKWSTNSTDISLTGDDTTSVSFTAPDVDSDISVTFDVLVTDNDGATANQSITITITRKVASVTITGLVTDDIISNAEVEITVGGQAFSVTADQNGIYAITITVDESLINQLVKLRALGDSSINPEVEFVSLLGSLTSLIEQAGSDDNLTQDENFGVNITNVTTAEFALVTRDGTTPTTDVELSSAINYVNTDEKNILAALIKIVVDNGDFNLPSGVTSTLDLVSDSETATAFEQAVNAQAPALITKTINTIINDSSLTSEQAIVGTWKVGSDAITFSRSGHYVHITSKVEEGSDEKIGYEMGSYSWNKSTGSLSFITTEDSNGESGLHNEFDEPLNTQIVHVGSFTVTDDMLTINEGDETFNASRLVSDSNPFVGGFYLQQTNFSDDLSILITVDDSKAVLLIRTDSSVLPSGVNYFYIMRDYSYDAETSLRIVHSQQLYVDGNIISEKTEEVWRAMTNVQGDIISMTKSNNSTSFIKKSHTTTTQNYLTDDDVIGNFSGTNGEIDFNISLSTNGTGQGSGDDGSSTLEWKVVFGQLLLTLDDGSIQIWSPTILADDVWQFNVNEYDDAGDFNGNTAGTLTSSDLVISPPEASSIAGTWTSSNGQMFSITFSSDGHYVHMHEADPSEDCDSDGYELGTYVWNETSGVVTVTTSEDTNGCVGLHDEQTLNTPYELEGTFQTVDSTMTITEPSGETSTFERIISDTNPLVGAYYDGDFGGDFFLVVFEDNGKFMELAHDTDELGLTAGTYNWDPSSTLLDFTSVSFSQWGSNPDQIIVSMQGDILIWKDGEDAGVSKRTHQSTEQPYLADTSQVIGSFSGIAYDNFGFQATLDSDFTGVITDDDGTFGFDWTMQFGQLIVDYGDEITVLTPTTISPDTLEFNVADFDLIDTSDGNEVGQVEYFTNTWTRN
jgi:hypothetical protein